jgi:RimJ/RimL family protein N-acetyltransferase
MQGPADDRLGFDLVSALAAGPALVSRETLGVESEAGAPARALRRARTWEHACVVTPDGTGARIADRVRVLRGATSLGVLEWAALRAAFGWRHWRLRRRFGARPLAFRLETPRLVVRPWTSADRLTLAGLASDPRVMRWIGEGRAWSGTEVDAFIALQRRLLVRRGVCLGATVERATGEIVGLAGLQPLGTTDDVEVGWWLVPSRWGRGYATEIGAAALRFGVLVAGFERVVAVARPENAPSLRVMARLGMRPLGPATGRDLGLRFPGVVVRYATDRLPPPAGSGV